LGIAFLLALFGAFWVGTTVIAECGDVQGVGCVDVPQPGPEEPGANTVQPGPDMQEECTTCKLDEGGPNFHDPSVNTNVVGPDEDTCDDNLSTDG
jgi:hypothetical protein